MQPMVATAKEQAREAFGKQFRAELTRIGIPDDRKRIKTVHKRLMSGRHELVTYEQVRKYIKGIDFPDMANLWTICHRLGLDWNSFGPGNTDGASEEIDGLLARMRAAWAAIDDDTQREHVVRTAELLAGKSHQVTEERDTPVSTEVRRTSAKQ